MSGAGFFAGTTSPAAIVSNQPAASGARLWRSSADTFSGEVVVAIASRRPAARASRSRRATPARSGIAPVASIAV